ncbi:MAG: mucoidy inhibitor MuiA family protein [Flavobacteriia bacterium]|nr:mucoidy inhibitor MuiA family protein [Flavobacteriia bacterium]
MFKILLITSAFLPLLAVGQNDKKINAPISQVTVFTSGAQIKHVKSVDLSSGKQVVVFEKLTDYVDPNSIQLKSSSNATILSVRTRKDFDEVAIAKQDVDAMNAKRKTYETEEQKLRDEYSVLLYDEQLLLKNNDLGSQQVAVKIAELKEASVFFHSKLTEIQLRKSQLEDEIEVVIRAINQLEQEINTRRSLPVKNYTEIQVELDVEAAGKIDFEFSYITPNASWKPYYDMRSNGVGAPVLLEAKGLVTQNTGENWDQVQLILSTNDPYDNTQEATIDPWYLNYYTPAPRRPSIPRPEMTYNYSGETVYGEVIDAVSGEPLAFAKIQMNSDPNTSVSTDAGGRFSFVVPRGETMYSVNYLGYNGETVYIDRPFRKILLYPQTIAMEGILSPFNGSGGKGGGNGKGKGRGLGNDDMDELEKVQFSSNRLASVAIERVPGVRGSRSEDYGYFGADSIVSWDYEQSIATAVEKDLRMEFQINTPFSIPSDNADHRVAISTYEMPAVYEYHAVPKLDPSVYLVAQISGWEKLNLLSGESNLYFDGTFIGKSYVDVHSTRDTLSFSLGKDRKLVVERKQSEENTKTRAVGNRTKYEVQWDFTIRNNGAASIPFIMKDHFPISINDDIKVKQGTYTGAVLNEKTGILTWRNTINKGETKQFSFNYSVDYSKGQVLYLE